MPIQILRIGRETSAKESHRIILGAGEEGAEMKSFDYYSNKLLSENFIKVESFFITKKKNEKEKKNEKTLTFSDRLLLHSLAESLF